MPSRLLQLCFVCLFTIFGIVLAVTQSKSVVHANQANAVPGVPKQHAAAIQRAAPLPPVNFGNPAFYSSGWVGPSSVVAADVNGDGQPDLIMAHDSFCFPCSTAGSVSVLLGKSDGTFQAPITYSSGGYGLVSVAIGDVNGDGRPDLVVSNFCQNDNCSTIDGPGDVSVLLGNGGGTFQAPVSYSSGGGMPVPSRSGM